MPLQNRVTPEGEIIAVAARGTMMGNRGGCMHTDERKLTGRRWVSRRWICCELEFRGRHRQVMAPGRYTELFFLDEATALAAGHRPCFECRRSHAFTFAELWGMAQKESGAVTAARMDRVLHRDRLLPTGAKRTFRARLGDLPTGAMVRVDGQPHLYLGKELRPWTPEGYGGRLFLAAETEVDVLTPPTIVLVLGLGYLPRLHSTAGR